MVNAHIFKWTAVYAAQSAMTLTIGIFLIELISKMP